MRKPLFVFGPLAFLICLILPLDRSAAVVIGTIFWMASWWISEVIPLGITALLPLIIAPLFGIAPANEISLNYAKSPIFLFLGGFILARAIEKYNIHRFLAANIIRLFGKSELGIFIGISLATYFLSMWISNTSTTMIMIPLILSLQVGSLLKALAFTAAYSSSIGGMATLVGTPPNIIYAGTLRNFGLEITFLDWLKFGLPYSLLLETAFLVFSSFVFKLSIRKVDVKTYDIALDSKGKAVLFIFIITAILWITLPLWEKTFGLKADDSTIAIFSGVLLFVLGFMGWDDIKDIPWDALLLFGGGFALSDMIVKGKLSDLILNYLSGLKGFPPLFFVAVWSAFVLILTEFASNTSISAILLPLSYSFAQGMGLDAPALAAVVAISASGAFILPIATPPNMLVYSFKLVGLRDIMRMGVFMNIIALILNILITYNFAP